MLALSKNECSFISGGFDCPDKIWAYSSIALGSMLVVGCGLACFAPSFVGCVGSLGFSACALPVSLFVAFVMFNQCNDEENWVNWL